MLYREIIAVCSEIHTKHTNALCGQKTECLNVKLSVHIARLIPSVCTPQSVVLQANTVLQQIARLNWQSCRRDIFMPVPAIAWQPRRYAHSTFIYSSIALQSIRVNDTRLTAEPTVLKTVHAPVSDTHYPITRTSLRLSLSTAMLTHLLYAISVSSIIRWHTSSLRVPLELTFLIALSTWHFDSAIEASRTYVR